MTPPPPPPAHQNYLKAQSFRLISLNWSSFYLERFAMKFVSVHCNFASLPEKAKIAFCEKIFWFSLLIMFFESSRNWWIRSSRPSIREFIRYAFRVPLNNEQSFSMMSLPMGKNLFQSHHSSLIEANHHLLQNQNEQQIKEDNCWLKTTNSTKR